MTMAAHTDIQLALRVKLQTLLVCSTGSTSLSATTTGYARAVGSFLDDGFAVGMELTSTGFATNGVATITALTPTTISIAGGRTVESSASGRSLSVLLPALRAWENELFTPTTGVPYVEEQYIPGPQSLDTIGPNGLVTIEPMYSPRVYVPDGTGISGGGRYADAIQLLFAPKTAITLTNGDVVRVRGDTAPFRGQRLPSSNPGWSVVPVTIPLRIYTTNAI